MAAMVIKPTRPPTAISKESNGQIPPSLVQQVDRPGHVWAMATNAARGMRALHAAVLAVFGVQLSSTGRGRTFDSQLSLFVARHDPITKAVYDTLPATGGKRRVWPDAPRYGYTSIYWRLKPGMAAAAVPGTSPHGWWCADDICLPGLVPITKRPDILDWLYVNAGRYGFAWSLVDEPWHLQWFVGDVIPAAVLAYEASLTPPEEDMAAKLVKRDDGADAAFTVQGITLVWVDNEDDLTAAQADGDVVPTSKLELKPASYFKHRRLVGPLPPGWAPTNFRSVVQ